MTASKKFILAVSICAASLASSQEPPPTHQDWDLTVWTAAATGEENSNSFAEAQIVKAGVLVGKSLVTESGSSWRRGGLEYALSLSPVFLQISPESLHGIAFEPVILRWNSNHSVGRIQPYIEIAGGAVHTNGNLPAGDTSNFNFTARGGGGVRGAGQQAFDAGLFWSHISNANLGTRNPEFNGLELRIAYHWFR
jgi:Lipid A 3-O-deacylase (PagL)